MEPEVIFIDTGAFYARYRPSDAWHREAMRGWKKLEDRGIACVTSSLVLAECASLLSRLIGNVRTAERMRYWLSSRQLKILRSDLDEELGAVEILQKYADQAVGFVDCISIELMRRHRIKHVFGFDRHFAMAGFTLWPSDRRR